ncbi:MAG: metal ABC transporter substrate-binding protein [Candidatus Limnocylindria bacterium]
MKKLIRRPMAGVLPVVLLVTACAPGNGQGGGDDGRLPVVATTTVIADLVANVGGDLVEVNALVPPGGEVHTFDPSPSDVTRVADAAIVFQNGLGLDDWLTDLVADAGTDALIVTVGEDLSGVAYRLAGEHGHDDEDNDTEEEHADEDGHDEEATDPHLWLNVSYARLYVERIADGLAEVDPNNAEAYRSNAQSYGAELDELDAFAREALAAVPEEDRRLVSFHDGFGYFADAYGLEIVDTVIDAPGQDPSAGEVAAVVDAIRESDVRAILAEAQFPTDLADRIAEETGVRVVSGLVTDSLGEPPADSYIGLIRTDVDLIVEALH